MEQANNREPRIKYDVNEFLEFLSMEEAQGVQGEENLDGKLKISLMEEHIPNDVAIRYLKWANKKRERELLNLEKRKKGGKEEKC